MYFVVIVCVHCHHCLCILSSLYAYIVTIVCVPCHRCMRTLSPLTVYIVIVNCLHCHHCQCTLSLLSSYIVTIVSVPCHRCLRTLSPLSLSVPLLQTSSLPIHISPMLMWGRCMTIYASMYLDHIRRFCTCSCVILSFMNEECNCFACSRPPSHGQDTPNTSPPTIYGYCTVVA